MATSSSSRRQPTRSARTSTNRPTNYYAKPFSYRSGASSLVDNEPPSTSAPGFFPAVTHFTDGVAALPSEVQRHFTMLKETESKAHLPDQAIADLVTAISRLPPAPRPQTQTLQLPFMQLSMANSINGGSANGSVVDGVAPGPMAGLNSDIDMPDASQPQQATDEYAARRHDLHIRLQYQLNEMSKILDEKNMVLTTANETLGRQLVRLESSFPHIENELSEDARLGSNTHWALPHMKELRRTNGSATERRRDVTNVNNLAAAAAAVHETEIAATRSEARREAMLAKRSRAPPDFGFDDRGAATGRKTSTSGKVRKTNDTSSTAVNGSSSSSKRRRVDKPSSSSAAAPTAAAAAANERSMSAALNGRLAQPGRSRDTSTADASRKKSKPAPPQAAPRKKNAPNSPSLASSPTRGTFTTSIGRAQSPARTGGPRARQSSVASLAQEGARKRPVSAASPAARKVEETDSIAAATAAVIGDRAERPGIIDAFPEDTRRPSSNAVAGTADTEIKREAAAGYVDRTASPAPHSRPGSKAANASQTGAQQATQGSTAAPPKPHNIFADVAPLMARSRSGRGINPSAASPGGATAAGAASPLSGAAQTSVMAGALSGAASPLAGGNASGAASPVKRSHKRGGGSTANARDAAAALASAHGSSGANSGTAAATPASSEDEGTAATAAAAGAARPVGRRARGSKSGAATDDRAGDSPLPGAAIPGSAPSASAPSPRIGAQLSSNGAAKGSRGARPPSNLPGPTAASVATTAAAAAAAQDEEAPSGANTDEDEGDGEAEPLYCFCQQPSEGEMIACDNEACPTEWFHLECVALARAPKNSWFCSEGCKRQAARGRR